MRISAWSSDVCSSDLIMARKDIRTSGEAIPLTHHSARGNVQRNAGNFTRGSQLITHEMLKWFSGATLTFILWFFAFAAAWFIIMSIQLDDLGLPLVVMMIHAHLWTWIYLYPKSK